MNMRVTQQVTYTISTDNGPPGGPGMPNNYAPPPRDPSLSRNGGNVNVNLNAPPPWASALLKKILGDGGASLPPASTAAKSIRDFQKQNNIDLISIDQIKQMADTGECKLPNGSTIQVSDEVQLAAAKMMENNGELFKKEESAIRGSHDGLLSAADYDATLKDGSIGQPGTPDLPTQDGIDPASFLRLVMAGTLSSNQPRECNSVRSLNDFQQNFATGPLNQQQLRDMADIGQCKLPGGLSISVPPDVQLAARRILQNDGDLFNRIKSQVPVQAGNINGLPSETEAGASIQNFQKDNKIGLLSIDQVTLMADKGYCKLPDGSAIQVPPEVQLAAAKMMENNGALFKKEEAAIRGSHDGLLSQEDYDAALKDGSLSSTPGNSGNTCQPGQYGLMSRDVLSDLVRAFLQGNGVNQADNDFLRQLLAGAQPGGLQMPDDVMNALQMLMDNDMCSDLFSGGDDYDMSSLDSQPFQAGNPGNTGGPGNTGVPGNTGAPGQPGGTAPLPMAQAAGQTIHDFQMKNNVYTLEKPQLQQMADTGKLTLPGNRSITVSPQEQAAARKMLENNGALFDKVEAANTGKSDGRLAAVDYDKAVNNKMFELPDVDDKTAKKTIHEFEQKNNLYGLNKDQLKQILEQGVVSVPGNPALPVSDDMRAAAKKMLANDGQLFNETESGDTKDDTLSMLDLDRKA